MEPGVLDVESRSYAITRSNTVKWPLQLAQLENNSTFLVPTSTFVSEVLHNVGKIHLFTLNFVDNLDKERCELNKKFLSFYYLQTMNLFPQFLSFWRCALWWVFRPTIFSCFHILDMFEVHTLQQGMVWLLLIFYAPVFIFLIALSSATSEYCTQLWLGYPCSTAGISPVLLLPYQEKKKKCSTLKKFITKSLY